MKTSLLLKPILICVCSSVLFLTSAAQTAKVLTGKSYVNITKGLNGGTIEPGDTLEIRATIAVGNFDARSVSRAHYVDTIPANTTYIPGTLKMLTNEGLEFKAYTDAPGDDPAYFDPAGYLRINLGSTFNAGVDLGGACNNTTPWSAPNGGLIHASGRPSFFGGVCIISASFRIRVNPSMTYGSFIYVHGGSFYFRNNGTNVNSPCNAYTIALKQNTGLCANAIGANAVIDYGGTFGTGNTQNRATSAIVPGFLFQSVAAGQPNDGSYSIVNNMSPSGNTNPNSPIPNATNRVHARWDIMGDHTGATDPLAGNLPVAPGANGGYFVAVNAAYANSNAIQQTVGGLCPNTYYEFSAWFKNICKYCACDSTGDGSYGQSGSTFFPNPSFNGPDSSGVNPNLTFTVDGVDYYTSGNLKYTGQWVKKGFVYQTGPGQTSFTITIRNNAAGGGGNDWAIDDVTLATCTPNLDLRPSPSLQVCVGHSIDMFANIRCYFPNYIHWRWEKSTDGGSTWSNTGVGGIGTPVLNGGEYEYQAPYPTFPATTAVDNSQYRVRIASTLSNLDDNSCSFAATTIITLTTQNCTILVQADIQAFSGRVVNELAQLQWTAFNEANGTSYEIESSTDKIHFTKIGTVDGNLPGTNTYHFTDPRELITTRYYRIRITDGKTSKYSRIIQLAGGNLEFAVRSVVNPFKDQINIEMTTPDNTAITITLLDTYGRVIKKTAATVYKGFNTLSIPNLEKVLPGAYIMQIQKNDQIVTTRLIKN
ncbi:T9SS C-terminal target domain-containing protein [Paraflavitalea soli]|uniref:T9SS C-terminal target domain-containing protein n=1 Tax=Paraflavitalea soli TaxID=2315862 RepID=A0A3B7MS31_9BACT|nr:T9SS type A sorting domain-containing protein [Paraflavitalea soli]AXY77322.1 T9SS C-terminal target domain-containing protein [Paraflavitalea soli]